MSPASTAAFGQDDTTVITSPSPSPAQVALALIILKSKPVELSLAEYFDQLRKHIRNGPRDTSAPDHEHIDSVSFWKQAYERSEVAQANLLDRIYELEQHQKPQDSRSKIFDLLDIPITGKRKRGKEAVAKANCQSTRRAAPAKPSQPSKTNLGEAASTINTEDLDRK